MLHTLFISMQHMNDNKATTLSRILLILCGLGLIGVLFTPIWRIDLQAPQYPEGLRMFIYANKLSGDINIINGLNHYIGMKTLHTNDFIEFKILPGVIMVFSALFLLAGIVSKRKWINILLAVFVTFGVLAMVDFWKWEYNYGHNLNPDAAIIVPGMSYQPPLIGYKQLLNFGAYSIPGTGGWIFVSAGIALLCVVIFEWRRAKKSRGRTAAWPGLVIGMVTLSLISCNTQPKKLRVGLDSCDFCKMTISDARFGAEIVTTKGKVYKFDDAHCIIAFLQANKVAKPEMAGIYFTDFSSPHELIMAGHSFFMQSPLLKSPMEGNIAAFSQEDSLVSMLPRFKGNKTSWEDMQK